MLNWGKTPTGSGANIKYLKEEKKRYNSHAMNQISLLSIGRKHLPWRFKDCHFWDSVGSSGNKTEF